MNLADLSCYLWPDGYEGRQPQDTYQIDTSLGVNIAAAVSRGNYDIAAQVFRLVSGALPLAVTAGGIGLKNTGSSTNYLTIPAPIGAGTVFAVLAVYVPNTATGTHLICDADSSATDRDFQLRQNGTAVEFIRFNTTPSAVTASVSGALKIGAPTTILAISDGVNVTLYAGSGIGTATITGSPSSWTCSGEWLSRSSNHTGTPLGTDGSLCLGAYITGAVPPATAKILVSNPWQIFAPRETRLFVTASSGSVNGIASGSFSPVSITPQTAGASGSASASGSLASISITPATATASAGGSATASGSFAALSISPATATATATTSATASGAFAVVSLSAPTATASGTTAGGANATGAPAQITISHATAIAIGSAVASGGLQSIGITAPSATASAGNGNATAFGSWAAISITAPTGYASSGFIRAPSGSGPTVIQPGSYRPSNTGGRRY